MLELVSGWRKVLAFTESAKSKAPVSRQSRKAIYYTSGGLGFLLFVFVTMLSYHNWEQHKKDTKAELETIQEVGANAVDSYFKQIEGSMLALVESLNDDVDINSSLFKNRAENLIKNFHRFHSEMSNIFVQRGDGAGLAIAAKPIGVPLASIVDTDSFNEFLKTGHKKFDVGRPLVDPYFKKWVIPIRLGVNDKDSKLKYFVGATLPVDFLVQLWKDAHITMKAPLGIMRDDGFLVSRYPNLISVSDKQLYETPRKGALIEYLSKNPSAQKGFVVGMNTVEKTSVLFAFRRLSNYPLTFFAALPMDEVWSSWQNEMKTTYLLSVALLLGGCAVFWILIRRQKAHDDSLQNELLNSERSRYERDVAMDNMAQGLCMFDAEQRLIVCNRQYAEIYGLSAEQTKPGTTLREIFQYRIAAGNVPDDSKRYIESSIAMAANGESANVIHQLCDGRYIAVTHKPKANGGWVTTHEDITSRKTSEAKVEHLARHDKLTGLANRATLMERVEEANARLRRRGETFSLLVLDLDKFKQVNDTLGHSAGDALLQEVASRLKACLRETDMLARRGGDEFAIIQSGEINQQGAAAGCPSSDNLRQMAV